MKQLMILAMLLPAAALGSTIFGNPTTEVVLVDGDDVFVHSVTAYRCGGGSQSIAVNTTLDQWDTTWITLGVDTYCDVVVRVRWTAGGEIVPVAVSGFDALVVSTSGSVLDIELSASLEKARIP